MKLWRIVILFIFTPLRDTNCKLRQETLKALPRGKITSFSADYKEDWLADVNIGSYSLTNFL